MLVNASDFRYVVNPSPANVRYDTTILPAVDGTAAVCVDSYTDLPYLVEMARERAHWCYGAKRGDVVTSFSPTHFVDDRYALQQVARSVGVVGTTIEPVHTALEVELNDAGVVGASWQPTGFPKFADTRADVEALFLSGSGLQWTRPVNIVRPVDCDTLRRLYYDLSRARRYLVLVYKYMANSEFSSYVPPDNESGTMCYLAEDYWYDQTGTTHSDSAVLPAMFVKRYSPGGTYRQETSYDVPHHLDLHIRKPFFTAGYDQEDPPYPGNSRYHWAALYERYSCLATWGNGGWANFDMIATADPTSALRSMSAESLNTGYYSYQVSVNWGSSYDGLTRLNQKFTLANDYAKSAYPGYGSAISREDDTSLSIAFRDLYFDTGRIIHKSDLPSTWTWTPPAST